ncbi:RusA family crossover junction endodeoxyribonuclease [Providencia rettgeri]|uniref:Crossover junction endodeoxyribonuclease rusA n=1 Tax=Providencia rettgeri TaxID=587 RepID=A0AAP2K0S0_PRORE|nr:MULTISPECIES: RusA family crossover junction endodeoxyribonuclease [Providencia]ELR5116728.1 RusA family crossover junction endodeoxyribonuclease [Providencia rettgeri]MBX6952284.1 RusA family crossover junction endodeoxyribonuclease [Providencia rettgeri]MBX6958124.1 RusA family crossover junction endodeoxyribonuclease [Providencia rettgeri]MBX6962409.1 RusA family crossover junction endodeoxyribonuclease [Providencia rettgeri]MBX6974711.1 RusA family crossover junction endodeoxyribonuclea
MNEYHLKLPWPPSNNTYWRHCRGRHYISPKGTNYRKQVTDYIEQQNLDKKTTSRIKIVITANPPDKRKRDLDNLPKAVFDSLTHANFWDDDEQIDDFRIKRGEKVKGGSLDITIWEIGDAD